MILYLLLAIVLRLIPIGQSLWLDESIQALALQGKMGPILDYALSDFQPPLYHLVLSLWTSIFGTSEVSLRLPSFLAGIMVVYLGSRIAKELSSGSRRVELIVGFLLASNPLLVYYSAEGRTYMMTTFFVMFSLFSLIKKRPLSLFVATLGVIWTSYLGSLLLLVESLYLIKQKSYKLLISVIVAGASIVLWLPSFISSFRIGLSTLTSSPAWGTVVGSADFKALALTWVKFVIGRVSFDNDYLYLAICSAIFLLHLAVFAKTASKKSLKDNLFLIFVFVVPILLGYFISFFVPIYQYFRVLFVLPVYFILLGIFAARRHIIYSVLLILVELFFVFYFFLFPRFHHEDWRQVVSDFGENSYYALPSLNQNAPLLYYQIPRDHILEPKSQELPSLDQVVYVKYAEEVFDQARMGRDRLLQNGYTKTSERSYSGLSVEVYTK